MRIVLGNHRFDTTKAKRHITLDHWDGSNRQLGNLWITTKNVFYMEEPTQWSNFTENYRLTTPSEILEDYRRYLTEEEIDEIAGYIEDWE